MSLKSYHNIGMSSTNPPTVNCKVTLEAQVLWVIISLSFKQMRFFMEIMWPVVLFMGLVWLRRVNPLYRQHECEKTTPYHHISKAFFLLYRGEIWSINIHPLPPLPQVTSPTRLCLPQGSCHGSRGSSVMPTTPVSSTPPVVNLPAWCPTTTTPCKHHLGLTGGGQRY